MKLIKRGIILFLYLVLLTSAVFLFPEDFKDMCSFYITALILGLAVYPAVSLMFKDFNDKGWIFSKVFGMLIPGYLMWLLSSIHIMKFTFVGCVITFVISLIACAGIPFYISRKKKTKFMTDVPFDTIAVYELLFLASFLFFCYMRSFRPAAFGQEKMMDFGFMNRMMFTDYLPFEDPWFSGTTINYYYFGQYIFTYLTKISGNSVINAYNMGMSLCFSYYFCLPFVIAFELTSHEQGRSRFQSYAAGSFAALIWVFAGNMQYVIYGRLAPMIRDILQVENSGSDYWYADSSRYIGEFPKVEDKTAVEFGSYSMVTGDLHAHVVNQLFAITFLGLILSYLYSRERDRQSADHAQWDKDVLDPRIITCAIMMGIFGMCNSWDTAIYFVVAGALLLASNIRTYKKAGSVIIITGVQGAMFLLGLLIPAIPFYLKFVPMAGGVALTSKHSLLYQLIVMWGLPFALFAGFTWMVLKKYKGKGIKHTFVDMPVTWLYVILTGLCAFGLVLLPEIIYVVDIYGGSYERFNTMFKLTYQSNSLLAVIMGYTVARFVLKPELKGQRKWGVAAFLLIVYSFGYFFGYSEAWLGNYKDLEARQPLDAERFIENESPEEYRALQWVKSSIAPGTVMLECEGDAYSLDDRMAVFAGTLTPAGWHTHEWLWHNDPDPINDRSADVRSIYTASDEETARELLDKYEVEYIMLGSREYAKYADQGMNTDMLCSLGDVVYEDGNSESGHTTFIIKIRR